MLHLCHLLFLHHTYCSCFGKSLHNNYSHFVISLYFKLKNFLTLKKFEKKKMQIWKTETKITSPGKSAYLSYATWNTTQLSLNQLSCKNFYVIEYSPKFEDLKFVIYIIEYKFTEIYVWKRKITNKLIP